jgi:hypothetical protein
VVDFDLVWSVCGGNCCESTLSGDVMVSNYSVNSMDQFYLSDIDLYAIIDDAFEGCSEVKVPVMLRNIISLVN